MSGKWKSMLLFTSLLLLPFSGKAVGAEEHSYELMIEDCTWDEAFWKAKALGGHLATLESREEFQEVLNLLKEEEANTSYLVRLGGRRDPGGRYYYWVDGENQLTGSPINDPSSFTAPLWMNGEPSFQDGEIEEDVIDLFYSRKEERWVLNDVPNDILAYVPSYEFRLAYLLEFDSDSIGEPVDVETALSSVPANFFFSSGAGGWDTDLTLYEDGSFSGVFHDFDLGSGDGKYEHGVCYICEFTGSFEDFCYVSEGTFSMRLGELNYSYGDGDEWDEDGTHYIPANAYGIAGGDLFYIFYKGHPLSTLPGEFRDWVRYNNNLEENGNLGIYGLFNLSEKAGFAGVEEDRADDDDEPVDMYEKAWEDNAKAQQNAVPGWEESLKDLREKASREGALLSCAYLGFGSSAADFVKDASNYANYYMDYSFLSAMSSSAVVDAGGGEVYVIVPTDPEDTLTVSEFIIDESDDYQGHAGAVLYQSPVGSPIFLGCNLSDIMPNTQVTVTTPSGEQFSYTPFRSLRDGMLNLPEEGGVLDFTLHSAYTDDELGEMAMLTYERDHGYLCQDYQIFHESDGSVAIKLFDSLEDHTTASEWYYVDPFTTEGTDILGDPVRLLDVYDG